MKFFKYLLFALTVAGQVHAMRMTYTQPVDIIDGNGQTFAMDTILLRNSKTLQHFAIKFGLKKINFSECYFPSWLTTDHLTLVIKALYHKDYEPFWQQLSIQQLHDLHKVEDYLEIEPLCNKITHHLQKRDPEAFKPYTSLFRKNPTFDATLLTHKRAGSIKEIVRNNKLYPFEDGVIDLSDKKLCKLNGLSKLPLSQRYCCNMLDLSHNNVETLDLDKIFHALPNVRIIKAKHAQIKKLTGKNPLPKGTMLLLAHNKISDVDENILYLTKECCLDLENNYLTPEKIEQMVVITQEKSLGEKARLQAAISCLDARMRLRFFYALPIIFASSMIILIPAAYIAVDALNDYRAPFIKKFLKSFGLLAAAQIATVATSATIGCKVESFLKTPFLPSYLNTLEQNPFAEIHSEHITCAAQKIAAAKAQIAQTKHIVTKKRNTDNSGLELLLKK